MIRVGIDYSLNSPAVCVQENGGATKIHFWWTPPKRKEIKFPELLVPHLKPEIEEVEMDKYVRNAQWTLGLIQHYPKDDLVINIEDYAFGASGRLTVLGENCGIMKYLLHSNGFKYNLVGPRVAKKQYTGNGNAGKGLVVETFRQRTCIDLIETFGRQVVSTPIDDIADAHCLAMYTSAK